MKLTHEHLIVAHQFGIQSEHLIHEIVQAFNRHPIVVLQQMEESEPRMVVALRYCTFLREARALLG